jgi:serine protease inhibitor
MTLVLPDNLRTFESGLTPAVLTTIQARIAAETKRLSTVTYRAPGAEMDCGTIPYAVQLYLPRFGIDTRADLLAPLQAMGLRLATSAAADFSGMTTEAPLAIGTVIHVANIDVDETGTEAAAVTVVGMDTTGGCGGPEPVKVVTLRFDRPFLFLIRDVQTGAILFMGRVVDPTTR